MSYGECRVLDLSEKLRDSIIKETIMSLDNITPEEKIMLWEEYSEKYKDFIKYKHVERQRRD